MAGSMALLVIGVILTLMAFLDLANVAPLLDWVPGFGQKAKGGTLLVGLILAVGLGMGIQPNLDVFDDKQTQTTSNSSDVDYRISVTTHSNAQYVDDSNLLKTTGQQYNSTADALVKDPVTVEFKVERFDTVDSASIFKADFDDNAQTTNGSRSDSPYDVLNTKDGGAKVKLVKGSSTDWGSTEYRVAKDSSVTFNATIYPATDAVRYGLESAYTEPYESPLIDFQVADQTFSWKQVMSSTGTVS